MRSPRVKDFVPGCEKETCLHYQTLGWVVDCVVSDKHYIEWDDVSENGYDLLCRHAFVTNREPDFDIPSCNRVGHRTNSHKPGST